NGGSACEPTAQLAMLFRELGRQCRPDTLQELRGRFELDAPFIGIDGQRLLELARRDLEAVQVQLAGRGNDPDGSFAAADLAVDSIEHPLEHAQVLAVARPYEIAVAVLAEPVDHEDARRMADLRAHREPVAEVVAD